MEGKSDNGNKNEDRELNMMTGDKLRALARLMHRQEEQRIYTIPFHSESHRSEYLRHSRKTYELALGALDHGEEVKLRYQDDDVKEVASAAHNLYLLSKMSVGSAFRTYWNMSLRSDYLKKIRAFSEEKTVALDKIKSNQALSLEEKVSSARGIIEEIAEHKQLALDTLRSRQFPSSRYFGHFITRRHHLSSTMFYHMEYKYDAKIAARDPYVAPVTYKDLQVPKNSEIIEMNELGSRGWLKKLEVYDEIASSSGVPTHETAALIAKRAGATLIFLQAAMIVWDTCTSDDPTTTLVKDSGTTAASFAGGIAGEMAGSAVAASALTAAGVATTTTAATAFLCVFSAATGFGLGIAAALAAGWLLDKILEPRRGDTHKYNVSHPATGDLVLHVSPVPDGERLFRQVTAGSI